ncbi:GGDEF domain-containing protein [Deinococcus depolymerans]|uniref:GGDEF domain-containing protein n=1 Tax=Deinococcus depolymerans TaxID=392408 RepID=A0ABN1BR16_9DEIO
MTSLPQRLQRSRLSAVCIASSAYLLYALLTALIDPPGPFPGAYQTPKYWATLVPLVTVIGTLIWPHRLREIYTFSTVGYLLVALLEIPRAIAWGAMPMHLTLWLMLNVLVSYLVFGARIGTTVNIVSVVGMIVSVVANGPVDPPNLVDWITASLAIGTTGLLAYLLTAFIEQNLDEHHEDTRRLRAARLDALTEVYGRGAAEEEFERARDAAQRMGTALSIILTDIDHFKRVNDGHGHAAGDDVLRAFGKRLRRSVSGGGGVVGRWGGEEFIVLLPGVSGTDAYAVAERLRQEVAGEPVAGLPVTASFGVASYRGAQDDAMTLFSRADSALYEAKRAGRNAVR